jgi:DNA-binding response OmpR family regulator
VAKKKQGGPIILVVVDDEEIRDGIGTLLKADGYQINPARNEKDAIGAARRAQPDLILVSLAQTGDDVAASARRVRICAGLRKSVPIVMFSILTVAEGAEVAVGENAYATSPANFDQLRKLLSRLLDAASCYTVRSPRHPEPSSRSNSSLTMR